MSTGKAWSTVRVDLLQGENSRVCASAIITLADNNTQGIILEAGWRLHPPAHQVDLTRIKTKDDPQWAMYHTAFHAHGFRRGHSYVKNFIPRHLPSEIRYIEQWICPGWDCTPLGSRDPVLPEARWTSEMIQFAVDMSLPIQENFLPHRTEEMKGVGSVAATLGYAASQEEVRKEGKGDWRKLDLDGSQGFDLSFVHVTLSMTTEVKKLPAEGVRWLYLRTEAKCIRNGMMDLEILVFDDSMV
ncbi:MAG: hypothetical protein M1820_004208 [Bogoriella megaspora]|nr:MAG: hypothetical protein M1820_004208 [Bogoriella megaspora]